MFFALDLGGTNFRVSWTKFLSNIEVMSNTYYVKNTGNYKKDSERILDVIKSKSLKAEGIAVALPGYFNQNKMVLEDANNLKTWIGKPFFKDLKNEFGCSLVVDKDSTVAAIGEGLSNALYENKFLYITWGTGIGGSVVTTKTSHLPKVTTLNWENTFRQIETFCGGGHAVTNFGVELKYLDSGQWNTLIENFVNEMENICSKLKLKTIILGGGVTAKRGDIVSIIQKKLKQRNIKLIKSNLGDFSAIHGGYGLLWSYLNDTNKYCLSSANS